MICHTICKGKESVSDEEHQHAHLYFLTLQIICQTKCSRKVQVIMDSTWMSDQITFGSIRYTAKILQWVQEKGLNEYC